MSVKFDEENGAAAYFQEHLGTSLEALLAPIEPAQPAGRALRGSSVYGAITQARRQDDASLPMGSWEYELKRADWGKTSSLCAAALATQSKDLQLAAWLLEAQINQTGFAGIAACFYLMQNLCERYWDDLHPQAQEQDLEYRANIFRWVSDKLLPTLRMVELTAAERKREYCWADLELARRNEHARNPNGTNGAQAAQNANTAPGSGEIMSAMAAGPTEFYVGLRDDLRAALSALESLRGTLDERFGSEAPGMTAIGNLLQQILHAAEGELHKRGLREPEPVSETEAAAEVSPDTAETALAHGPIRDRADAYARLAETAEYLMRLEPHSPVPYLVRRATVWGGLNTVELYQELFLKLNGQLNIFEMLGLTGESPAN